MNFLSNFILLLKARYPIIYIVTSEEERVEYFLKYMVKKHLPRAYYSWDFIDGFKGNPNDKGFATRNPLEALEFVDKLTPETAAIFVLKDYDNFLNDLSVTRKLKNLGRTLKLQPKNLVIVSPELNIPDTLKEFVTVIELPLPTYSEISSELKRLMSSLEQQISEKTIASLSTACQGLSLERVRRVLSKIIVQYGEINELSPALVLEEKKQLVQQTQVLEFCLTNKKISDLGGLENLKSWLEIRDEAFSQDAITYGLPYPKGVLLVGAQGTGKSITAEIIANEWKLPLLRLDFGRLFASLVGQSESRVRSMIQTAEALSPCVLYIDEIDKAFGGRQSSGDNGTSNRVLATFLTWLGEKISPVFVVATANNIDMIPPEAIRKGRFDEVFFLALPNQDERKAIFKVHLENVRPQTIEDFQVEVLGSLTKDFSGAEIEQVVIDAMRLGFNQRREFTNDDLIRAIQTTVPLARTKNKELRRLLEWSESGNVTLASKQTK